MRTLLLLSLIPIPCVLLVANCVGDPDTTPRLATDSGTDATPTPDSSPTPDTSPPVTDAGVDAAPSYASNLADQTKWEKFDITPIVGTESACNSGAFDGRYIYYVPNHAAVINTILVRYDTHASFTDVNSWDGYDLKGLGVGGFAGAVFAGHYLYLVPYDDQTDRSVLTRYDTTADFKTASSYITMDLKTNVDPADWVFGGGAYDNKFLYLTADQGNMVRFDTTAPFDASTSYQSAAPPTANGEYAAGIFDGKYVYYPPTQTKGGTLFSKFGRFDTSTLFATPSFVEYDLQAIDPKAEGFDSVVYDGNYIYLVPFGIAQDAGSGGASLVVRYNPNASFTDSNSYSTFDLAGVDVTAHGFEGATFDGRYAYFVPFKGSTTVRFDTTGSFGDKNAWQAYDLSTSLTASAKGFSGGVFDGEYVYFVPYGTSTTVRFHAKTPASLPSFRSSFY